MPDILIIGDSDAGIGVARSRTRELDPSVKVTIVLGG